MSHKQHRVNSQMTMREGTEEYSLEGKLRQDTKNGYYKKKHKEIKILHKEMRSLKQSN